MADTGNASFPQASLIGSPFPRERIVGVRFDVCDYAGVLDWLAQEPRPVGVPPRARYVCVSNVADVMTAREDPAYREALEAADLVVPDGAPVVWAMRDAGHAITQRVYGPTLMEQALRDPRIATGRHLLVGGSAEARAGVRRKFSEIDWIGEMDFRFDSLDEAAYVSLAERYTSLNPDYTWVCLGGGRQVYFNHQFSRRVKGGILLGVGAAFDFHAGLLSQAPRWIQDNGLEWLYRLCAEPRRLWHRYLVLNPPFLYHWWRERGAKKRGRAGSGK